MLVCYVMFCRAMLCQHKCNAITEAGVQIQMLVRRCWTVTSVKVLVCLWASVLCCVMLCYASTATKASWKVLVCNCRHEGATQCAMQCSTASVLVCHTVCKCQCASPSGQLEVRRCADGATNDLPIAQLPIAHNAQNCPALEIPISAISILKIPISTICSEFTCWLDVCNTNTQEQLIA